MFRARARGKQRLSCAPQRELIAGRSLVPLASLASVSRGHATSGRVSFTGPVSMFNQPLQHWRQRPVNNFFCHFCQKSYIIISVYYSFRISKVAGKFRFVTNYIPRVLSTIYMKLTVNVDLFTNMIYQGFDN